MCAFLWELCFFLSPSSVSSLLIKIHLNGFSSTQAPFTHSSIFLWTSQLNAADKFLPLFCQQETASKFENKQNKVFPLGANEKGEAKLTKQLKITVAINNSLLTTDQVKCAVTVCCSFCPSFLHLFFDKGNPVSFHTSNLKLYVASAVSQFLSLCSPLECEK